MKWFWILYFIFTKWQDGFAVGRLIPGFLILVDVVVVVLAAAAAALGSRLPVVRVCLGEDHLGCFQPALLGRSSPLALSCPV